MMVSLIIRRACPHKGSRFYPFECLEFREISGDQPNSGQVYSILRSMAESGVLTRWGGNGGS